MVKEAIILAGGLGTRLRRVVKDVPKPMANINGKPFLEYLLLNLERKGIEKVVLSVGYRWKVIENYFGKRHSNIEILYSAENTPLGTGGAIKQAINLVDSEEVFILNGDTLFDIDLDSFFKQHKNKGSNLSLALKRMENCDRYGTVEIGEDNRIVAFLEKENRKEGLINGGVYLLNKAFFSSFKLPQVFSFEKEFLYQHYKKYPFYGFPFDSYFIDIGVPDDYEKAKIDFTRFKN